MGRPRKITEKELIEILENYIADTPYLTSLKYSDIVKYAQNNMGYKDINYQDFSRNKKIKDIVKVYKQQKDMTAYMKQNEDRLEKLSFDVDALVDKYKNDSKQLKVILKVFKDGYNRAFDKLSEHSKNDIKNMNIIKEQEKEIKKLKEKNTKLRADLNAQTQNNKNSFKIERLKWMYILLKDMTTNNKYYIETEEEIIDILKNFGYESNDIADVQKIIDNEFSDKKDETVPPSLGEENIKTDKHLETNIHSENVESINNRNKKKLQVPNFMK